jgi:hypothetical protein
MRRRRSLRAGLPRLHELGRRREALAERMRWRHARRRSAALLRHAPVVERLRRVRDWHEQRFAVRLEDLRDRLRRDAKHVERRVRLRQRHRTSRAPRLRPARLLHEQFVRRPRRLELVLLRRPERLLRGVRPVARRRDVRRRPLLPRLIYARAVRRRATKPADPSVSPGLPRGNVSGRTSHGTIRAAATRRIGRARRDTLGRAVARS